MAASKGIRWSDMVHGCLATVLIAVAGFATGRASADIIKKEDTLRGITMTRAQCAAIQQTVWVRVYNQDFCVRYYLSTAGGEGPRPVVFWNGDSNGPITITQDKRTGKVLKRVWENPSRAFDVNTDAFVRIADDFSKMAKTTAIYIGRIGVEGTSGNHLARKTLLELHLMNAALDAIKQRHRFEGFNLAGQSGGSRLALALGGMRRDIGCVVSGSGQLGTESGSSPHGEPDLTYFDLNASVIPLAHNHAMRIFVVTDPKDQQAPPATEQNPFLERMKQALRIVPQFLVQSTATNHHDVLEYTQLVMAGCVLGRRDPDLRVAAATIIRRNTATIKRREEEAKLKAAGATH
jgi:hypothetical protein